MCGKALNWVKLDEMMRLQNLHASLTQSVSEMARSAICQVPTGSLDSATSSSKVGYRLGRCFQFPESRSLPHLLQFSKQEDISSSFKRISEHHLIPSNQDKTLQQVRVKFRVLDKYKNPHAKLGDRKELTLPKDGIILHHG